MAKPSKPVTATPDVVWPQGQPRRLRAALLAWHQHHGRHHLPWVGSGISDPSGYATTVSEIMMQQTTVSVGIKRYPQWMATFPTWASLATASDDEVMKAWEGLGYYARARRLHALAKSVHTQHNDQLPLGRPQRLALPGVGPTTASALGAFVHGQREPIWDTNVDRVWRRWWGNSFPALSPRHHQQWRWEMGRQAMPATPPSIRRYTQAIMDLGAQVCTPKKPLCGQCPWAASCHTHQNKLLSDSPPVHAKKKVTSIRVMWGLALQGDKVALMPPGEQGIWAGLWQLPRLETEPKAPAWDQGQHALTHRQVHWSMHPISPKDVPTTCQWVPWEHAKQLAWPKPLRVWWDTHSLAQLQAQAQ